MTGLAAKPLVLYTYRRQIMRALYRTLQLGIKIITTGTVVDDSLRYEGISQPDTPEQSRCPRSRAGCCLYIVTLVIYLTSCCVYMMQSVVQLVVSCKRSVSPCRNHVAELTIAECTVSHLNTRLSNCRFILRSGV